MFAIPSKSFWEFTRPILRQGMQKTSFSSSTKFYEKYFQVPSLKLVGKDRVAVIAKQLSEFLQLYSRETEIFHAECSGNHNIAESSFHVS